MPNNLIAVDAKFLGGHSFNNKTYTYLCPPRYGVSIFEGDFIITSANWPTSKLPAVMGLHEGLSQNVGVAQVVRVFEVPADSDYRFFVALVAHQTVAANYIASNAVGQRVSRIVELKKQLDQMLVAPEVCLKRYEQLANVLPAARPLLNELKALNA